MKSNRSDRKKKNYRRGFFLFSAVFLCLISVIVSYYGRQYQAKKRYEELIALAESGSELLNNARIIAEASEAEKAEKSPDPVITENAISEALPSETEVHTEISPETEEYVIPDLPLDVPTQDIQINFENVQGINEDIYAWIVIPDTQVNYPILQHPTDDAYYLDHTVDHVEGLPGSIYTESVNSKDFTSVNTVIYGHNMKDGSMFASMHQYKDAAFMQEHPYVYILLPEMTLVYRIFTNVLFSDAYLPEYCDYTDENAFNSFVEELRSTANVNDETVPVVFGDRLLTLSTCQSDQPETRLLTEAVLLGKY